MAYYLDLFSPETYEAFGVSDRTISGFRPRQRNIAGRVRPGDKLLCYVTRLSRWAGVFRVVEGPFVDDTPIFYAKNDPFVVRFRVNADVWLPLEKAIPIYDDQVWNRLSFTKEYVRGLSTWTGKIRASLAPITDEDGSFLEKLLLDQRTAGRDFPIQKEEYGKLLVHRIRRADKDVSVTIPEDSSPEEPAGEQPSETRESTRVQALLAEVGSRMGMQIWLPRADRSAVLAEWLGDHQPPLERLPLNYDETTLRTIEQIDVLWLRGRSIRRAFEVEHTTSIYSGILRMADLLALQPNMDIKLHIVAPVVRRDKVFQELRRPVFSLLERGPLSEHCTYLSYDSVRELAAQQHLAHLSDTVLDEYEEEAE